MNQLNDEAYVTQENSGNDSQVHTEPGVLSLDDQLELFAEILIDQLLRTTK